jgi:transposase-like protein
MGRTVDLDDLVDASEIARRFGVQRHSVVHDWRRRHDDFPKPVFATTRTRLWLWPEVKAWGHSTGRL